MQLFAEVLARIFNLFFGCRHQHLTRLFTLEQETYKVCLDCGGHVFYSADTLRPLSAREIRRMRAAQAGEVRVLAARESRKRILSFPRKNHAA